MEAREVLKWSPRSRALEGNSGAARRAHLSLVVGVFHSHDQLHGCSHGITELWITPEPWFCQGKITWKRGRRMGVRAQEQGS